MLSLVSSLTLKYKRGAGEANNSNTNRHAHTSAQKRPAVSSQSGKVVDQKDKNLVNKNQSTQARHQRKGPSPTSLPF